MNETTRRGVTFYRSLLLSTPHGFSTRLGGVSEGALSSLNLGVGRGDRPERLEENWRRFGAAVGIPVARFAHARQVHGDRVCLVRKEDARGILEPGPWAEGADGLVTGEPGLPLAVFTADCAPLLLYDPRAAVAGAVHCGWRSTAGDIMARAVEAMESLGARRQDIRAAVGPCIGPCCFQTGPEVPERMEALLGGDGEGLWRPEPGREGKFLVDLAAVVLRRLAQLGLDPGQMEAAGLCTVCREERFWSHRRCGGTRGSQANVIML